MFKQHKWQSEVGGNLFLQAVGDKNQNVDKQNFGCHYCTRQEVKKTQKVNLKFSGRASGGTHE